VNKIICFDLDNVICKTKKNNYKKSIKITKVVNLINLLYSKNYYIKIFTARGMGTFKGNKKKIEKKYLKLTVSQLIKWQVKYHELILYKPSYDLFIDDKALGFKKNWHQNFQNVLKKI
tara:strand:- start:1452 stop:1805 length:354 start_codon:yes stop_codon:yes gene_type:complete